MGLRALACLAAAFLLLVAAPAMAQSKFGAYAPPAKYPGGLTSSLYLPMRDGVRLAVSITRPVGPDGKLAPGKFPVIWTHQLNISRPGPTPVATGEGYSAPRSYGGVPMLVRQGYVVVEVARRGMGPSFGRRRGYNDRTEAYDAYEVIDYLASQSWSTGAVGVYGCSNTGDAAMHAVTAANPHLKAAWAGCFSWEKYDGFLRGGIFANWGTGPERTLEEDMRNTPVQGDEDKVLLRQAAQEHQGATVLAQMWRTMPFRDSWADGPMSRFWYEGSVASFLPQIRQSGTTVYVQGGWNDDLRSQGLTAYANMPGEKHIVIGPWTHCAGDGFDMPGEMLRFFDWKLKGLKNGIATDDPIHYFVMGAAPGTEWRSSKTWPVAGTTPTTYYFAQGGQLAGAKPSGRTGATSFSVRYDVDCPDQVRRTNALLTGALPCPNEHGGPHYVSGALTADTEVTGDAVADLWVSANRTDANVFVYLEDVAPDGKVSSITDARLKASLRKVDQPKYKNYGLPWHRSEAADAQPLTPGEPVRMTFTFLPTSYIFKAGHKIRISVQGADFRERDRTPLNPAPQITLLNDADHPSAVILPVIKR